MCSRRSERSVTPLRACLCCLVFIIFVGARMLMDFGLPHFLRPTFLLSVNRKLKFGSFSGGLITGGSDGRLGNNMAEYATIFALGIRYNVTAVATPYLLRRLKDVFPHTSLPVVANYYTYTFKSISIEKFEALSDEERQNGWWKIGFYLHRIRLFWYFRESLRKEFSFRGDLAEYADGKLRKAVGGRANVTFVGVHVRRTDYAHHVKLLYNGQLVNESFYLSAFDLCRRRYHQPVFIVTSDDLDWCREHLSAPDVHILGSPQSVSSGVERDMALLAACNHTVFDYGTYGFFGAFLAGGDLILLDGVGEKETQVVDELRHGKINATFLDTSGKLLTKCIRC